MHAALDPLDGLDTGAIFSPCRRWRYMLWRRWDVDKGACVFIGLNPSTADETKNDPTVRRCLRYAKDWGYGSLWMLNLFAFRATRPEDMKRSPDCVGPRNNEYLLAACQQAAITVAAWGVHGGHLNRDMAVLRLLSTGKVNTHALAFTHDGQPRHPLYLRADLTPEAWTMGYGGMVVYSTGGAPRGPAVAAHG